MGIIIYGEKEVPIGLDEYLVKCPSCEKHSWADIMVVSHYFHFYLIPFWPTDKDANVVCNTCGLKRYSISFNQNLISNYNEVKGKYKHPWFTRIGLIIIILIIVSIITAVIF